MKRKMYSEVRFSVVLTLVLMLVPLLEAKPLKYSKQAIKAKKIIVILKYMDKHGCKMQKKVNDMAHIYRGAIFSETTNSVSCATYGRTEGKGCSIPTTTVIPNRPHACVIGMDSLNAGIQ